jgi:FkbM family methyltransferase
MLDDVQRWWRTRGTDIYTEVSVPLEFHGSDYGGWAIAADSLDPGSVVLSFGIGEDITFGEGIIAKYGCTVQAFDPTPKALAYVEPFAREELRVYPRGLGAKNERRAFHLPRNPRSVSGSIANSRHLDDDSVEVDLRSLGSTLGQIGVSRFDVLKMDIEGSEYEVLRDDETMDILARQRPQLLVEFHHRFAAYSKEDTQDILARLRRAGVRVAWVSRRGEEVLFLPHARG